MRVFCDTNLLLDVLVEREPFYENSARIWALAEARGIQGIISVLSYPNVFYVVRRLKDRHTAQRAVLLLRDIFEPVAIDEQMLHQAIDAAFVDLEDAFQFFGALRAGADCLVTRNPRHFPDDDIPVFTPAEFLAAHFPA
jgi:predicted nucleic acid-binding protein